MTHDKLLAKINSFTCCSGAHELALRAVVELHIPDKNLYCEECCGFEDQEGWIVKYPCPTIQAIEKELG